jgi:hypothetical protein
MNVQAWVLVGAVAAVGVLHTIVPDHWVPITLIARQRGWSMFFAAGKYGVGLIALMALVSAASTIATYMLLCVYSAAGLQRVKLGAVERYGEVLSGAFIAAVGVAFYVWPVF